MSPESHPRTLPMREQTASPIEKIDPDELERRLAATQGRSLSSILFRKAQLHWELAFHPDVDEPNRVRHAQGASDALGLLTDQGTKPAPGSSLLMYAQLPDLLYPSGRAAQTMRQITTARSLSIIDMYETRYRRFGDSAAIGICTEIFALHGLRTNNIRSAPSLRRQENTTRLVDKQSYAWDVTLRSSGDFVSPGVYRTQVKHSARGRRGASSQKYHPDLVRFNLLSRGESLNTASPYVFSVARMALGRTVNDQEDIRTYVRSVNRLYATLNRHGPSVVSDADLTRPFVCE